MRRNNFATSILSDTMGAWSTWRALPRPERMRIGGWIAWILIGAVAFAGPLIALIQYASETPLNSHTPLIPVVSGYLLFIQRKTLPSAGRSSVVGTLALIGVSAAALYAANLGGTLSSNDALALQTLAFVSVVAAGGFLFMGARWMAAAAFPMAFLVFMIPMPDAVAASLETMLMHASADVSEWFLRLSGTPFLRRGMVITLPTIVLEVARECSGIRSSWVLFITSLIASHMFLGSTWRRVVLVAFVIPLGIIRNGFRILVLSLLCVHVGPHMIDTAIHHRGGPIFFALSLIPLFLMMIWLRRGERVP